MTRCEDGLLYDTTPKLSPGSSLWTDFTRTNDILRHGTSLPRPPTVSKLANARLYFPLSRSEVVVPVAVVVTAQTANFAHVFGIEDDVDGCAEIPHDGQT